MRACGHVQQNTWVAGPGIGLNDSLTGEIMGVPYIQHPKLRSSSPLIASKKPNPRTEVRVSFPSFGFEALQIEPFNTPQTAGVGGGCGAGAVAEGSLRV